MGFPFRHIETEPGTTQRSSEKEKRKKKEKKKKSPLIHVRALVPASVSSPSLVLSSGRGCELAYRPYNNNTTHTHAHKTTNWPCSQRGWPAGSAIDYPSQAGHRLSSQAATHTHRHTCQRKKENGAHLMVVLASISPQLARLLGNSGPAPGQGETQALPIGPVPETGPSFCLCVYEPPTSATDMSVSASCAVPRLKSASYPVSGDFILSPVPIIDDLINLKKKKKYP